MPDEARLSRGRGMALTAAILGWMFDGLEMGLFPLVGRPALRDLGVPVENTGEWFGNIIAVFLVGAAAGGVLFGWLGDRIGRVRAMIWSVLTYAIFSGLCGFARTPLELAGLRFVASLGMGGEWSLGVALVMELWPAASRPLLAGLIGAAANVGFLLIGIVALRLNAIVPALETGLLDLGLSGEWVDHLLGGQAKSGWRILMMLGAAPAILTLFIRLWVPESERWRTAAHGAPKARVREIFAPGIASRTLAGTTLAALALLGTWGSVQWLPTWAGKLSGGLSGAREWTQIASALGAIVGTVLAAFLAEWLNRRTAYFLLSLISLASCVYLFWRPLFGPPFEYGAGFLLLVGIVGATSASFYGWLPLYLPELFPTRIRATGQGFAFNMGRVLAAAGTLGSGALVDYFDEDYARMCRVISLVYVVSLVVIWFCPETKGKPLPE